MTDVDDELRGLALDLVGAVERRTARVVAGLRACDDDSLAAPSALPGWSRVTITCHLRYGAVALSGMTTAAIDGAPAAYYPGGRDRQRPATLQPEPHERPSEVVASLARHSEELHDQWSRLSAVQWDLDVVEPEDNPDLGRLRLIRLPLLRLTEVEVHGSDLLLDLDDWSDTFVRVALPFRLQWLNSRRTNHRAFDDELRGSWLLAATDGPTFLVTVDGPAVTSLPADRATPATAVIEGSSRDLLALLLGRPVERPLAYAGDERFAHAFRRAFPGP